jgi:hypothetical protein
MDRERILFALRLPAVLRVCLVAVLLGFCDDAIYFFVEKGLLKPIGASEKVELLFDSAYINGLRHDPKWKAKAVNAWRAHTKERNEKAKAKRRKNEMVPTQISAS